MSKKRPKIKNGFAEHIRDIEQAHSDLNMFYAAIALMENGLMSADADKDAQRVIRVCQQAGQRCLRRYDRAVRDAASQ